MSDTPRESSKSTARAAATPATRTALGQSVSAGKLSALVIADDSFSSHPLLGDSTIGRSTEADIYLDHPSISRRHALLRLEPLTIEDLGSANGTRVGDQQLSPSEVVPIAVGEVVEVGRVTLIVQRLAAVARPRRIWVHGYFEARLDGECARAHRSDAGLAVLRVRGQTPESAGDIEQILLDAVRAADVVGYYAPNEYEALLVDIQPEVAREKANRISAELAERDIEATVGIACYPEDGSSADALLARAGASVRGDEVETTSPSEASFVGIAMQQLGRLVERVAAGNISVLILGETGVGKELMAEAIHRLSPRADAPLVKLNCAALSESLLESELFGHERGAFTGAVQAKPGLLEVASGGTVFLDEIGELPMSVQVKLLRVLEQREVLRVGGLKPTPIDVRFVSATNRDPETEIGRGTFRQDLYFRLNGISIGIPPLRDRADEIRPLALEFASRAARDAGRKRRPTISREALALLENYTWPGNIRELRNFIERAVLLAGDGELLPEHLPIEKMAATTSPREIEPPQTLPPPSPTEAPVDEDIGVAMKEALRNVEREHILRALAKTGGNQAEAAALLGMSRRNLIYKLDALGIERPRKKGRQ